MLSKKLNMKIEFAICISLKDDDERRNKTIEECNKINLPVKFFLADKHPLGGVEGCKDSHKQVIQYAKKHNLENILILEDDVSFDLNMIHKMKPLKYIPQFDMLYLGYHVNRGYRVGDQLLELHSALTTHAYIINHNVYDILLEFIDKEWDIPEFQDLNIFEKPFFGKLRAIDVFYAKYIHHARKKTYGIYPMIAYQRPSYSSIEQANVDYKNLFIRKALYFSKINKSLLRCQYVQTEQNKVIEFLKNSGANPYDYIHVQPTIGLDFLEKNIQNTDWDILYIKDDEYYIRKHTAYKTKDTWQIKYLYPGCSLGIGKKWLPEKPVLCIYGEENKIFDKLSDKYIVFYCSEKYTQLKENRVPKHQYHMIPTNRVVIQNDITFFIDQPLTKPNVILWMTQDTFNPVWKCDWWNETGKYTIPFNGKSLFTNMSSYIISILFETQDICDAFCKQYNVIYNPKNMHIVNRGKHNYDFKQITPLPWKIIGKTNGKNFNRYIDTFKRLKKILPQISMNLYGCTKNNKKHYKSVNGISCFKTNIIWDSTDIVLMLQDDENLYWEAKMASCIIISDTIYPYMDKNDICIDTYDFSTLNREELKRKALHHGLQEKRNNFLLDFLST